MIQQISNVVAGVFLLASPIFVPALFRLPAQSPQSPKTPAFEVSSVKPSPDDGPTDVKFSPDRLTYSRISLRVLIRTAYRVQDYQIYGGPSWLDTAKFNVDAKADGKPEPLELIAMLRGLLEDRFRLAIHHESKILTRYVLMQKTLGGRLGPDLKPSDPAGCSSSAAGKTAQPDAAMPPCGGVRNGPASFRAASIPISQFALAFSNALGASVDDRTGLEGKYDISLEWRPEPARSDASAGGEAFNANSASLFTAIQEQLGLKLQPDKGPVDVLVVDHAEKRSGN